MGIEDSKVHMKTPVLVQMWMEFNDCSNERGVFPESLGKDWPFHG